MGKRGSRGNPFTAETEISWIDSSICNFDSCFSSFFSLLRAPSHFRNVCRERSIALRNPWNKTFGHAWRYGKSTGPSSCGTTRMWERAWKWDKGMRMGIQGLAPLHSTCSGTSQTARLVVVTHVCPASPVCFSSSAVGVPPCVRRTERGPGELPPGKAESPAKSKVAPRWEGTERGTSREEQTISQLL